MAVPETKSKDLVDRLNILQPQDLKNDLLLANLRRDAEQVRKADPVTGYTLLGIIECVEENISECHRSHKAALKIEPNNTLANLNYASSLLKIGETDHAIERLEKSYERNQGDIEILSLLIKAYNSSGKVSKAVESLNTLQSLNTEINPAIFKYVLQIQWILRQAGLKEEPLSIFVNTAYSLIREKSVIIRELHTVVGEDEDSIQLSYEMLLYRTVDEVVALNEVLCERLARLESFSETSRYIVPMYRVWS